MSSEVTATSAIKMMAPVRKSAISHARLSINIFLLPDIIRDIAVESPYVTYDLAGSMAVVWPWSPLGWVKITWPIPSGAKPTILGERSRVFLGIDQYIFVRASVGVEGEALVEHLDYPTQALGLGRWPSALPTPMFGPDDAGWLISHGFGSKPQ